MDYKLICKHLVNFLKLSLKIKWSVFVVGVNFGALFSNSNCDPDVYEDKSMIFGNKIIFCKVDDGST